MTKLYTLYHITTEANKDDYSTGYIGITSKKLGTRFRTHKYRAEHNSGHNKKLESFLMNNPDARAYGIAKCYKREVAEMLESAFRPEPNMGLNVFAGGKISDALKGTTQEVNHLENRFKNFVNTDTLVFREEYYVHPRCSGTYTVKCLKTGKILGTGVVAAAFCRDNKLDLSAVSKALNGTRKSSHGLVFEKE